MGMLFGGSDTREFLDRELFEEERCGLLSSAETFDDARAQVSRLDEQGFFPEGLSFSEKRDLLDAALREDRLLRC